MTATLTSKVCVSGVKSFAAGDERGSDSHHLRFAQARALGRKVSDELTNSPCRFVAVTTALCTGSAMSRAGGGRPGIDPLEVASKLGAVPAG
jgi:hypothetical protein